MQNAEKADLGPETFGIGGYFEKRGTGGLEQEREQSFLVLPHQRDQVTRESSALGLSVSRSSGFTAARILCWDRCTYMRVSFSSA